MAEYNQTSFLGGMNLLADDTRLQSNQYRLGFNIRNRYDVLDAVSGSELDTALPAGIIQEIVTFGDYIIAFVSGKAYYRLYNSFGWVQIPGFSMSPTAARYWTCAVPVNTTNYVRFASAATSAAPDSRLALRQLSILSGSFLGNLPGLLVQDNLNQPQFLFIDNTGNVAVRITQNYSQWSVNYTASSGTMTTDEREYVPVGNCMTFVDGVLYIVSQDKTQIYHSVSGRPLDFMVNVQIDGSAGGDASTVAYGVGTGDITAIRGSIDSSLYVAAGNSNFMLVKNTANNAPLIFGEFMYVRKFLFEATCLNDRCIIDSLGDTRFIDLTGVRSFNAIQQMQNEGRNSPWTAMIQQALKGIVQDVAAAILYDNYELYAINTIFGPAIAVYDTISNCWSSFDVSQTGGKKIKQFAKIELGTQRLFAVTEDNKLYTLYTSSVEPTATVLTGSTSASVAQGTESIKQNNAKSEVKLQEFRCILNKIDSDCTVSITPLIDNRVSSSVQTMTKNITFVPPTTVYTGVFPIPDANTQLTNLYFAVPNCEQGWKVAVLLSWTGGGSVVQFSMNMRDDTPMNPLRTQATTR